MEFTTPNRPQPRMPIMNMVFAIFICSSMGGGMLSCNSLYGLPLTAREMYASRMDCEKARGRYVSLTVNPIIADKQVRCLSKVTPAPVNPYDWQLRVIYLCNSIIRRSTRCKPPFFRPASSGDVNKKPGTLSDPGIHVDPPGDNWGDRQDSALIRRGPLFVDADLETQAFVSPGRDLVAFLLVGADAADIRHEDTGLPRDVGADVP